MEMQQTHYYTTVTHVTMEMPQLVVTQQALSRYHGNATNSLLHNSNPRYYGNAIKA
jgi:hypothetical protein